MDFPGYFEATEQSFAQEKEDMSYRVDESEKSWEEVFQADDEAIKKAQELRFLKRALMKDHLQILRVREESLHMELKNAQLAFHVRQLQSELFRLLPHSQSYVPSTEYHMSLNQKLYKSTAKLTIQADPEHEKALKALYEKWKALCDLQEEVFEEERRVQKEDQEQWEKFLLDYKSQNHECHQGIDKRLADVTRKFVALEDAHNQLVNEKRDAIRSLDRRIKRLTGKVETSKASLSQQSIDLSQKVRAEAKDKCNTVRSRVREIEKRNLQKFSTVKEQDNELQEQEMSLSRSIDSYEDRIRRWEDKNRGLSQQGNQRIAKLEEQFNAVVSAAAALKDCTNQEEKKILEMVSGAVGRHASTAEDVEKLNLQIHRMGRHLQAVASKLDM